MSLQNQNEIKKDDFFRCQVAIKIAAGDSSGQRQEDS